MSSRLCTAASSSSSSSNSSSSSSSSSAGAAVSGMDFQLLEEKMNEARSKFERACQQIVLLDQRIKDLEVRYKRALRNKKNSFRYNLRLRLSVVTGVKMMYHHYASTKAEDLARLRRQVPQSGGHSSVVFDARAGAIVD